MNKQRILELELLLARTPDGRHIGDDVLEKIEISMNDIENIKSFTRCKLCGLQMDTQLFPSGCPNCGCKDLEDLEDRSL